MKLILTLIQVYFLSGDILKANDELTVVINNYKRVMGVSSENGNISSSKNYILSFLC